MLSIFVVALIGIRWNMGIRGNMGIRHVCHDNKTGLCGHLQRELRQGYMAATSFVDAQLGRVLEILDQTGLSSNTIVSFIGDHGELIVSLCFYVSMSVCLYVCL